MSFLSVALALRRARFMIRHLRLRRRIHWPRCRGQLLFPRTPWMQHHKRQHKLPSHNNPIRRQPPFAPIDGDQGGKGPWRVKSKPHPAIVPTGSVLNSNSFAALQCSENGTSSDPSNGGEANDACNNAEPNLGPTLNGVETDLRILNPSAMERVNRNESSRDNEDDGHVSSDSVLRSLNSDTTLPDGDQLGGSLQVPPTLAILLYQEAPGE
ncbi:hypothetical protein Nepgr_016643 [Nepenthes gracilis]|uniref:Uncharacterized protein n=1 Tax=Nepenthes gracilis TaxID=150966 RepID=A0AAD3XRH6_NEPGR|nr:hypothetical protein Nepgr_016643 [Nepenthes gracilis]